jgi:hypothetical protein
MRRLGIELADNPHHLGQFVHQPRLVLQAPGRVDQQHIDAPGPGLLQCFEGEPGRIGALLTSDDMRAGPFAPDLELLDRRSTEGVARSQHHRLALGPELGRELADRRRLARTVDPDHQDHERLFGGVDHKRDRDGSQDRLDLTGQDRLHLLRLDLLVIAAFADRLGDAGGGREAKIGLDQDVFQVLQRRRIELALGEEVADPGRQRRGCPRQPVAQPAPPAALGLDRLLRLSLGHDFGDRLGWWLGQGSGRRFRGPWRLRLVQSEQLREEATFLRFGLAHRASCRCERRASGCMAVKSWFSAMP